MISYATRTRTVQLLGSVWLSALLALGGVAHAKKAGAATLDGTLAGEVLLQLQSTDLLAPLLGKHGLSLVSQFGARPIYRLKVVGTADVKATASPTSAAPARAAKALISRIFAVSAVSPNAERVW